MSRKAAAIPRPGEAKRGPEGYLGYLLRQANAALRGAWTGAWPSWGVTTPQFSVLTMIVAYPGLSGADLARLTFLTPQTINVIVRNLGATGPSRRPPTPRTAVSCGCTRRPRARRC